MEVLAHVANGEAFPEVGGGDIFYQLRALMNNGLRVKV